MTKAWKLVDFSESAVFIAQVNDSQLLIDFTAGQSLTLSDLMTKT